MIIIADSGSTKCDWRILEKDESYFDFKSPGINPYFNSEDKIEAKLKDVPEIVKYADKIQAVFFYSEGSSTPELKRIVEMGLSRIFQNARIYVEHDMVAAAFAVYEDEPCIACILATGSNSCHFDGDIVREEVPSLSYILGDEGSGNYFGKKLLSDFLYKRLPENIRDALVEQFDLNRTLIMNNVYREPHANVYLASFMPFISSFRDDPYIREMIREGLDKFMEIHVKCFRDYREVKTHFMGSVAHFQEDILREVAAEKGIIVGSVIERPIDNLSRYHIKNFFK